MTGELPPAASASALSSAAERLYASEPLTNRWSPTTLAAAAWTAYAVWRTRRSLRSAGLTARVPPVPPLPAGARRGVHAVLRRLEPTCLERSLVQQAWLAAHGIDIDVVVGVGRDQGRVTAHAWVDPGRAAGESRSDGHAEIHRLPVRGGQRRPDGDRVPPEPRPYRLTPLQQSMGLLVGRDPDAAPLPRAPRARSARQVLEDVVLRGLLHPPCVISFSGGRDSSALLAVAAHVARREGLPLPVAVTLRFPDVTTADEDAWQERVVRHVGVPDWQRLALTDEIDVVGPYAQRVLRRHGLLWPFNAHFHLPVAEFAPTGSVLCGMGGDELFSPGWDWERVNLVLTGRRPLRRKDAVRIAIAAGPPAVRRIYLRHRRRSVRPLPWLPVPAQAAAARIALDAAARAPVRWDSNVRHDWWPSLYRRVATESLDLVARQGGAAFLLSPLCDGTFLDALARERGRGGFVTRTEAMEYLFGDVLPNDVLDRSSKGFFDAAFWNRHAQETVANWDGSGVDQAVADPDVLRRMWVEDGPRSDARSWMLLQSAWLAQDRASHPPELTGC